MDASRFDIWTQSLPQARTRRGLIGLLAGAPAPGLLAALLGNPEETRARKKRKKKSKNKHKKKPDACKPQSTADACRGRCGKVENNCGQAVACGPCACQQDPSQCTADETCCPNGCKNLQTDRQHCGACGNLCPEGLVCQGGACGFACGGDFCPLASEICEAGNCQPCDVCPSCNYTTIQAAIDAAIDNATIRICAGSYTRPDEDSAVASISDKNLTLVGAGTSAGGTILTGELKLARDRVFKIRRSTSSLRNLTITGALYTSGILVDNAANLTLSGVLVTGNLASGDGGGIQFSTGDSLILEAGTTITDNEALHNGGGIHIEFNGSLIINEGASVTGNYAHNVGGGIWNERGDVIIDGGAVEGNSADVNGEDIYNDAYVEVKRGTAGECVNAHFGLGCP